MDLKKGMIVKLIDEKYELPPDTTFELIFSLEHTGYVMLRSKNINTSHLFYQFPMEWIVPINDELFNESDYEYVF